jgi:hypothetical protein
VGLRIGDIHRAARGKAPEVLDVLHGRRLGNRGKLRHDNLLDFDA